MAARCSRSFICLAVPMLFLNPTPSPAKTEEECTWHVSKNVPAEVRISCTWGTSCLQHAKAKHNLLWKILRVWQSVLILKENRIATKSRNPKIMKVESRSWKVKAQMPRGPHAAPTPTVSGSGPEKRESHQRSWNFLHLGTTPHHYPKPESV